MKAPNLLQALTDNIVVDPDKCVFCGQCVEVCVLDNLRMKLAPCRAACPLGVNCQGYVQLIKRGDLEKAFQQLTEVLPFPGILGRVCTAPCEAACHHKVMTGQAVAIKTLKRYLAEAIGPDRPAPEIEPATGHKVAVVGSGPAGLMAAYDLGRRGHAVTIFESESEPGGMLRWAIPEFNLPAEVVDREIGLLNKMGVTIECNVEIGQGKGVQALKQDFDVIILAVGCTDYARLEIEGHNLAGVHYGLPLLKAVRSGKAPEVSGATVVIGGGNVALDAARTALRLGADQVRVVCLESEEELPADPEIVRAAFLEGVVFDHGWGPVRCNGKDGKLTALDLQRCLRVFDRDGRFSPRFDANHTSSLEADNVIIAIGQRADAACLLGSGLEGPDQAKPDPLTMATPDERIFMAGDFVTGPTTVIQAMASGRAAAESVHRFLSGEDLKYGRTYPGPVDREFTIDTSRASDSERVAPPLRKCEGKGDFQEVASPISPEQAMTEASRCYSCGLPHGAHRTCWFCLPCEVDCPEDALWVEIPYLLR